MLIELTDFEMKTLRAGLEMVHANAQRSLMNPDLNTFVAMSHEIILDTASGLLQRLHGGGVAQQMQTHNQPY